MKLGLWFALFVIMASAYSSEKGNGGSGTESQIASQQAQLELIGMKIRSFFLQNESTLTPKFPEFNIKTLAQKIKVSDIRVVNKDKLIDKHGESRTCLNFPDSSLIECKYSDVESLMNEPAALFVLMFHEYLGLIGAEETSPSNPRMIDGYSISKRLATYVSFMTSDVNNYDLGLGAPVTSVSEFHNRSGRLPTAKISNDGWSVVPKSTKRIKVEIVSREAYLSNTSFELSVRDSIDGGWKVLSQGTFEDASPFTKVAYMNFEAGKFYDLKISGEALLVFRAEEYQFLPHTERLVLTTESNYVIFDSDDVVFEFDKNDIFAYLNMMALDFRVHFR